MDNIRITKLEGDLYKVIPIIDNKFFGGGERRILIDKVDKNDIVDITFRYSGDQSIMDLIMCCDALKRMGAVLRKLTIPYFPGARQDRVCNLGEALSVKVYANLINGLNFKEVLVFDPHSEVTTAVLDRVSVIDNYSFILQVFNDIRREFSTDIMVDLPLVLVSPDAGANKKVFGLAKFLNGVFDVVRADKVREVKTGKIVDTQVFCDTLEGKIAVISDDIISYGGTFKALAKKLKEKGASKVYLIVSHCEGVADLKSLQESGIDKLFTTNSLLWDQNDYNKRGFIKGYNLF
jgi:ribose-phosphate pyrophosphokinase